MVGEDTKKRRIGINCEGGQGPNRAVAPRRRRRKKKKKKKTKEEEEKKRRLRNSSTLHLIY
jgi:hypothetical protein